MSPRPEGPGVSRGIAVMVAASAIAALALLFAVDPAASSIFPPCLWRAATGWLCPGCGSARALHALLHGEIAAAMATNPLTVVALPILALDVGQRWRESSSRIAGEARP